jgi:predicted alpha/beta hydrolase family esterase
MTKIYLIHRWGGSPSSDPWFDWVRRECDKRDIELIIPEMPDTDNPVIEKWVGKMNEVVNVNSGEGVYFIGHSIGCQAIMRYLGRVDKINVKGLVFVAPWMHLDEKTIEEEGEEIKEIARPWMETPIDFDKVKSFTNNILCILSDDDPYVPLSNGDLFKEKLGAEIIVKENEGHFNDGESILEMVEFIDKIEGEDRGK